MPLALLLLDRSPWRPLVGLVAGVPHHVHDLVILVAVPGADSYAPSSFLQISFVDHVLPQLLVLLQSQRPAVETELQSAG